MSWLVGVVFTAITTFTATNIDDILILMFFFSQVNLTFRRRHIIVGQYLGFTALIIASLPGFFGGLIIPKTWIGFLGFIPIIVGIQSLINLKEKDSEFQAISTQSDSKNARSSPVLFFRLIAIIPSLMTPQTYKVAAITFANGGDNIGIYVPLFASLNPLSLLIILGIFYILVGLWCYLANQLIRYRTIAYLLTHYGKIFTPFVLIGLGIFIIIESGTYQLLTKICRMG